MTPLKTTITRSKSASVAASTKQAVLGFTSAKRTASNNVGKKSNRTSSTPVNRSVKQVINIESSSSEEEDDDDSDVAEDDSKAEDEDEEEQPSTKSKTSKKGGKDGGVMQSKKRAKNTKAANPAVEKPLLTAEKLSLELQDKEGRWTKHYGVVREKMGNIQPGEYMLSYALQIISDLHIMLQFTAKAKPKFIISSVSLICTSCDERTIYGASLTSRIYVGHTNMDHALASLVWNDGNERQPLA